MKNQLIMINGEDRTDAVRTYTFVGERCEIVYNNSPKAYSYKRSNVEVLSLKEEVSTDAVIVRGKGKVIKNVEKIYDFGKYYKVQAKERTVTYRKGELQLSENCLASKKGQELFEYFKKTAAMISLKTETGTNILNKQFEKISAVDGETVLARYFDQQGEGGKRVQPKTIIYPFGLNQSQKTAVENALSSQVSIIQGPPGTGKTQTILNIIANAVLSGKTVAVVSNNNSAIENVAEKLEKRGLSFLVAILGSLQNKERFLESQTGLYPHEMRLWRMEKEGKEELKKEVARLTQELSDMLAAKNRIAEIEQELLALKPEQFYFSEYYAQHCGGMTAREPRLSSKKLLSLWLEIERNEERPLKFLKKLEILFLFGRKALSLFSQQPDKVIPLLQNLFYKEKTKELQGEKRSLEERLKNYQFETKMQELSEQSMRLFKAELAWRYGGLGQRTYFEKSDFRGNADAFSKEYPVVLSTTYSIKGTLSAGHIYDYLIVDEASQVDLATGVLALSCAKNVVIVGDQKQLSNVITAEDSLAADQIWKKYQFDQKYRFSTHSLLSSAEEHWWDAPSTLLREHYRCHPKIAGFFNQKFYNGQLAIMTEDHGEPAVLSMYRTAAGNHARGHKNQRQIDVIQQEILPRLMGQGIVILA